MDKLPVDFATAEQIRLGEDDLVVLATSEQTAGALFALEITMRPGGGPPVMHRHAPAEIYFVTKGEFTFDVGEGADARRVTAGAGDVVPLRGGTPHTIRNESQSEAVAQVVHTPGPPMEEFTRAAAKLATDGAPDMTEVLAMAERHGIEMLGPIPRFS